MSTKKFSRLPATVLTICMLFASSAFPSTAYAVGSQGDVLSSDIASGFELPDIVDEAEADANDYIGRVKAEEKDLNTFVFANGDGTNTMRIYSHPVKYVAEDGTVRDISLDVEAKVGGGFVTADHEIITTFERELTDGINLEYNNVDITLVPELGTVEPIATLSNDGKVVTYEMNDVTSFVYELTYAGFKEDIVVDEYTGQTEYEFTLYTNGLALVEEYGSYFLTDSQGNVKATIGDIIVFTADERNNTMGSMTYETVVANQEYVLTIHLDAAYLADDDTVYPIRIDPTIEINYDNNGAGAIEDVTINELATFGGTSGSLYVGRHPAGSLSRVLMRFPNLKLDILPTHITNASIEIRDLMCQGNEDIEVECYVYKEFAPEWSESQTTTWADAEGNYLGDLLDSHVISYGQGNAGSHRYSFSIRMLAKDWASGIQDPAHGVVFKASDEFENQTGTNIKTWYKTFASYNRSGYKPSLSITYSTIRVLVGKSKDISSSAADISGATWSSNNTSVATVSNGVVTGVSNGSATITATNGTATISCTVQVTKNGGTTYVYGSSLPRKTQRTISAGTSYIIRFYPYEEGYYSFYTSPESTTTLTDTTVALYSDSTLTAPIAFDDDGGHSTHACVSAYLNANTAYYFVLSAYSVSSTGVVTYNIMRGFPVSGSEIEYEPGVWNGLYVQYDTNCYSYAFNTQYPFIDGSGEFGLQPGGTSYYQTVNGTYITPLYGEEINAVGDKLLTNIYADASVAGFTFREVSRTEMCNPGTYKVALVVAPYTGDSNYVPDYHWYRQNPDGTWSHKPGGRTVRDVDNSGDKILDPATADRYEVLSDGSILNYTHVIGFYEVTPIDRMKVAILSVGTELQDVTVNTNDLREREISIAEWLCVSESAK